MCLPAAVSNMQSSREELVSGGAINAVSRDGAPSWSERVQAGLKKKKTISFLEDVRSDSNESVAFKEDFVPIEPLPPLLPLEQRPEMCTHEDTILLKAGALFCLLCRERVAQLLTFHVPRVDPYTNVYDQTFKMCYFHRRSTCNRFQIGLNVPPFGAVVLYEFVYHGQEATMQPFTYLRKTFRELVEFFFKVLMRTEDGKDTRGCYSIPLVHYKSAPDSSSQNDRVTVHVSAKPTLCKLRRYLHQNIEGGMLKDLSEVVTADEERNLEARCEALSGDSFLFVERISRNGRRQGKPFTLRKSKVDFYDNYYHRGVADENFKYEQRTFMTSTKLSLFHCAHVPIEESGLLADY